MLLIYPPSIKQVPISLKISLVNFHTECQFYESVLYVLLL